MSKKLGTYRILLGMAALILLVTGALHATGFSSMSQMLDGTGMPSEWAPALEGLWLMFSIHLVILAALLIVLAVVSAGRAPLAVAAAMPVADTFLLFVTVGLFVGTIMVASAAALVLLALAAHPARSAGG